MTAEILAPSSQDAMREYYQLQRTLFLVFSGITAIIFVAVIFSYSLNTALNYLLGATAGALYLRRLAKDIEGLGGGNGSFGIGRLVLFIAPIVVATQWQSLHVLPVFLGFLTYKAAIVIYVVQTTLMPQK